MNVAAHPSRYREVTVLEEAGSISRASLPLIRKRCATPATSEPTIGAIQKSHSCASAQPPTKSAGPVLRAGFTDVFGSENDDEEHERHHHLGHDRGRQRIRTRGVLAVAVGSEPRRRAEIGLAARDEI